MRILLAHGGETTAPGGINRTVGEVARHLAKRGHELTVLQPNPLCLEANEMRDGFRVIRVKSPFGERFYGLNPQMYFYLRTQLRDLKLDVLHAHGYHDLFSPEVVYLVGRLSPQVPLVFSFHLDVARSTFVGKHLWWLHNRLNGRRLARLADHVVAFSAFEANQIRDAFRCRDARISIIPHGVDMINRDRMRRVDDIMDLLYVGHLVQRKGVQHVLRALHELVHVLGVTNARLTIVGRGPEQRRLSRLAEGLKLTEYVRWLPFLSRSELIKTIKHSDLLLLLSDSEAYGIIVAEALALGTPVLVTKTAALVEFLIEPGCFGVDYPPDPKKVAGLIVEICGQEIERGGCSGRIRTWDRVTCDYESLYERMMTELGKPAPADGSATNH